MLFISDLLLLGNTRTIKWNPNGRCRKNESWLQESKNSRERGPTGTLTFGRWVITQILIWKVHYFSIKCKFQSITTPKAFQIHTFKVAKAWHNVFETESANTFPFFIDQSVTLSQTLGTMTIFLDSSLQHWLHIRPAISTCACQTVTKIERSRRGGRNTEIPNIKVHCRISS